MLLRKIIRFLVYSNIWISAGATLFGWLFYMLMDVKPNLKVLGFLFSSTLLTYTFQRYMKIHYKELLLGPRMGWMVKHLTLAKILLFASALATAALALYLSITTIVLLGILALISFFYAFKFNLTTRRTNLRDIPGIKIFLIGIVWSLSCALIPAIESEVLNTKAILIATGFFLYIVGITIPFDIRDVEVDEINKKTIPQLIGVKSAIMLAIILTFASFFLMARNDDSFIYLIPGIAASIIAISLTTKNRDELFFSFVLDGLLILMPIAYWLASP